MSTAVIDMDSIMFAAFHPNKILDENGNPVMNGKKFTYIEKTTDELMSSCDFMMDKILSESNATHYIAFIKGYKTTEDRLAINPEYKAHRPKEKPQHWDFCWRYLRNVWGVIPVDDMEVDDAVNITRLKLKDSFIIAIDGDLLGLQTFDKFHYNWKKSEWVLVDKYDAASKFWSDMIAGQKGDNLPGLKGKGVAFVREIFRGHHVKEFPVVVLQAYIDYYQDEDLGIKEYYKTYHCLKILDKKEGFIIPEPLVYKKEDTGESKYTINFECE